jgi:abortive infection bacteriophage resistance protein
MPEPIKPWLSIEDQIDRLKRRGMHIPDVEAADQWLSAVGYYRLSGYRYPSGTRAVDWSPEGVGRAESCSRAADACERGVCQDNCRNTGS